MDFNKLKQKIEIATKKAFIEMVAKHKEEDIYAFAIYSDEGAMTVCPSTNTTSFLTNLSIKEKEHLAFYKFEPAEWKYEMIGADDEFNEISAILSTELEKNDYENEYEDEVIFLKFQNQLYTICIDVLQKLKKENFFKKILGKDIFLLFSVSEYEFETEKQIDIIKKLNNKTITNEYIEWMKTWSND